MTDVGILIREGVIEAIGPRSGLSLPAGAEEIRAVDKTVVPGFIDIHIHGAGGRDVMEGSLEALEAVARKVAEYGTTALLAIMVTMGTDDICWVVIGISQYITQQHLAK